MPDVYLVIDLVVIISLVGLGLAVLLQNKSLELNRMFALFVTFVSVWILANYISNDITKSFRVALVANYFVFSFSYAAAAALLRFAISLAGDQRARQLFGKAIVPMSIICLTSFTPLVAAGVELQDKVYAVKFGAAAPVYFLSLLLMLFLAGFVLYRNIKRATGRQKGRLRVLFRSLYWSMIFLMITQVILPTVTGWFGLTNIGILSMLILVFGLYYSVVKHRLFDLRFLIVRALGYILSLSVIVVGYGLISNEVTNHIFDSTDNAMLRNILSVVLIVLILISYDPMKSFFKKKTNQFFYQDAYDPQEFLAAINKIVLSSVEIERLLPQTVDTIDRYLKPQFCGFDLQETFYVQRRTIGNVGRQLLSQELLLINEVMSKTRSVVIVTDDLADQNVKLYEFLQDHGISLIVGLSVTGGQKEDLLGYLIFGPKKSGNPYSQQDLEIARIIGGELAIAVQNVLRFEEIEKFNMTLQDKVSQATGKLRRTNDKLKAMDETKDDFISMASHQLRTPLTSIKGYVSMVLDGDMGEVNPAQRQALNQALVSSQRMVFLIADLLNLSRLKTGKFVIELSAVRLADVIESEVNQLQETAKGRELELVFDKPSHFPVLMLDETKIRQVIMNFLDNSIYYTRAGGHIAVSLTETEKSVEFTVTDDGIGVPKAEQHHLFNKFYRAGNARKARPDGTGLGLFMAKKVVVAQGGSIIFRSIEGKGSTFGFNFPKSKVLAPAHAAPTGHDTSALEAAEESLTV